jgi:alkane 1-monooxygenase
MWSNGKYLFAYTMPLMALYGLSIGNYWTFLGFAFAFVFIPLVETVAKGSSENHDEVTEENRISMRFFDVLLYLNLPLLYFIVYFYFQQLSTYNSLELFGATLSVGIMVGSIGINVAHELGHRSTRYEQLMAQFLLIPALYMHFFIEHNQGHHKNVATDLDPASSRLNESIYAFWGRSVFGAYVSAWRIETKRLRKASKEVWSFANDMIVFHIIQAAYLTCVYFAFGVTAFLAAIAIAIVGILLLESVNYIEHYGLRRKKQENGRFERVMPWHSWNSDHVLGRIVLYELTRHSDHHFKASRKYQILRHHDESPQLPFGYPGAILVSLIPPIWFKIMNKKVQKYQSMG